MQKKLNKSMYLMGFILTIGSFLNFLYAQEKPIVVQDVLKRSHSFTKPVTRIVSLSPAVTETLYAIGAGATLVGNTTYCTYPEAALEVQKVGGYSADTISVERIIQQQPELVIGEISMHRSLENTLKEAAIHFFLVDITRIEDIYTLIQNLAIITGRSAEGQALTKNLQERVNRITNLVAKKKTPRPRVFWEVWNEPLMTCGPHTFIGQILNLAGGQNIFSDLSENWPIVSSEMVLVRNPDYIMSTRTHGEALDLETLKRRPGWANLPAVRNRNIILFDDDIISRPGPRFVDAVELVAKALHPELF
ncbi:cobalamin-binding protein [Treponema sp. J25]|uniref:ABC transporter substrate-binding protein n=1 Tax=Treponema sp. J25 TaxID=2094121 RepID=UPI0010447E88|nr:cobalamin-binding protein [Treponema sp. J25]TCW61525.1 cobalamin-binding protein [Treponema sp. J25]